VAFILLYFSGIDGNGDGVLSAQELVAAQA
jgi:hypothetical protein